MEIEINNDNYALPPPNDQLGTQDYYVPHVLEDKNYQSVPRFPMGRLVATPNALSALNAKDIALGIGRHVRGDWGDLDTHDWQMNESALLIGDRLVSIYRSARDVRFYIITEADRSITTILLPEDY